MQRLIWALTNLRAERIETTFIIGALTEISVKAAKSDPPEAAAAYLDSMAAVLDANAQAIRTGKVMNMAQAIFGSA